MQSSSVEDDEDEASCIADEKGDVLGDLECPPEEQKEPDASELLGDYNVEDPSWQTQLGMAEAFLDGYHARALPAEQEIFVPWAVCSQPPCYHCVLVDVMS